MIVGVGGEPATGKSSLVAELLKPMGRGAGYKCGLLRYALHGDTAVLGVYDGLPYPGTDRLSMAVQPSASAFLRALADPAPPCRNVLFEGDRLFNASFLKECLATGQDCLFLILTASDAAKAARRKGRADTKAPAFLAGRVTKYRNLAGLPGVRVVANERPEDRRAALKMIQEFLSVATPQRDA